MYPPFLVFSYANASAVPLLVKPLICHALEDPGLYPVDLVPAMAVVLQPQEYQATGLGAERLWVLVMVVELLLGELLPERPLGRPMQVPAARVAGLPLGRLKLALKQRMEVPATRLPMAEHQPALGPAVEEQAVEHQLGLLVRVLPTEQNMASHLAASTPSQQGDALLHKVPLAHVLQPGAAQHQHQHQGNLTTLPRLVAVNTTTSLLRTGPLLLQRVRRRRDLRRMLRRLEVGKVPRRFLPLRGALIQNLYCIRGMMRLRRRRVHRLPRRMVVGMGWMRRLRPRGMGARGILIVMRNEEGVCCVGMGLRSPEKLQTSLTRKKSSRGEAHSCLDVA